MPALNPAGLLTDGPGPEKPDGPAAVSVQSAAAAVPPLSLVTSFASVRLASCTSLKVQIVSSPDWISKSSTPVAVCVPVNVGGAV